MSFKNRIQILFALTGLLGVNPSYAGNEGVSLYYGAGLGAMSVDEKAGNMVYDPAATGSLFLGLEEDGWALEYTGKRSVDAGTDVSFLDYRVSGSIVSLGYRTLESNGSYFKFAYGKVKSTYKYLNTISDTTDFTGKLNGNSFTIGMGMRLSSGNRMELDYSLLNPDSKSAPVISKVHMLSLRYLFDGAPPPRR